MHHFIDFLNLLSGLVELSNHVKITTFLEDFSKSFFIYLNFLLLLRHLKESWVGLEFGESVVLWKLIRSLFLFL